MTETTAEKPDLDLEATKVEDEALEIVVDEAPEGEKAAPTAEIEPEAAARAEISPEQGISELRAQMEAEKRGRIEAERRAREAYHHAHAAQQQKAETDLTLLRTAIDNIKRDSDALKREYVSAMEIGDYDKAAEAQRAMGENSARLVQIENGYAEMEHRSRQAPPPPPQAPSDPVEAFAAQLSPRSADWIRRHPECVTDQRLQQKMIGAHTMAVADGLQPDSDAYFAAIESSLRLRQEPARAPQRQQEPVYEEAASTAAAPVARRSSAPPAAPVSRSGTPGRPANVVRLSSEEAETARSMGYTPKEYAELKMKLVKEGRMKV
jgi:hypothetical protein